jgi:hypothetical protein
LQMNLNSYQNQHRYYSKSSLMSNTLLYFSIYNHYLHALDFPDILSDKVRILYKKLGFDN